MKRRRREGPAARQLLQPGTHEVGQEEHDIREHHQNGDDGDVDRHEGQRLEGYFLKGNIGDAGGDEHVFAQGRRGEPDAAAADEDDAEMDRINPVCCHNGQQNRRHQHDDGKGFHKHAEEQQEDNHKEPHQVHIVGEGQDPVGDFHRDPVRGEQVAESRCREDEHEHAARQPGRGLEGRHETFQRQFLMDEDTHEDGVENGHDGGFRRREDTGVDAAKDDHRGEDGPEAVAQGVDEGLHGPVQPFRFEVPAQEEVHDAEADGDEDARDDAGHEHFGNALLAGYAVDDHGDARRDDDADAARRGGGGGRIAYVIASLGHGRDHEHTHGGRGRGAGSGNGAEEDAGQGRGDREAAGRGADDVFGDMHETSGHACRFHE